jgi:hypothetical protein
MWNIEASPALLRTQLQCDVKTIHSATSEVHTDVLLKIQTSFDIMLYSCVNIVHRQGDDLC